MPQGSRCSLTLDVADLVKRLQVLDRLDVESGQAIRGQVGRNKVGQVVQALLDVRNPVACDCRDFLVVPNVHVQNFRLASHLVLEESVFLFLWLVLLVDVDR